MDKIPQLLSQSANRSGLDLPHFSSPVFSKKTSNRSKGNSASQQKKSKSQNSFAVFQYLILSTTIVFAFGGLGFGFTLRYSQDLQASQSAMNVTHLDQ